MKPRILMTCPAPTGSKQGNRITALRWQGLLRELGYRVRIVPPDHPIDGRAADILVALHARRSAGAVQRFRKHAPHRPIVVALTGTDLYPDITRSRAALNSLEAADRLIVLQKQAMGSLPRKHRGQARVIHQSAIPPATRPPLSRQFFDVCVLSHLRAVKDPLRAAMAARSLPDASHIRIRHAGRPLSTALAARAQAEGQKNPRYRWLGERSHRASMQLLARSRLLVLSSRREGGANVIGEAAVCAVPVLASRIDGSIGLLGADYPGYFPPGDTGAVTALLTLAETDPRFYARLQRWMEGLAGRFAPASERQAWRDLLRELYSSHE